jgi:hypothetical protein
LLCLAGSLIVTTSSQAIVDRCIELSADIANWLGNLRVYETADWGTNFAFRGLRSLKVTT